MGYHMARFEWRALGGSDPNYEAVMWNRAESVHEATCSILEQLGVFELVENRSNYRFLMPLENVRDHLANLDRETRFSFDDMLEWFLWCTAGYEGSISDEKEPFKPTDALLGAMWAMVNCGYAERIDERFQWTEKIAPIMIKANLWSREDGESFTTWEKNEAAELTEKMWGSIPSWRRHVLARWIVGKSEVDLFQILFQRWDGDRLRYLKRRPRSDEWFTLPRGYSQATKEIARRLVVLRRSHPL